MTFPNKNTLFPNKMSNRCFKLCRKNLVHHGFQYKEGLNVDHVPFNPKGQCRPGGLYFFVGIQILNWKKYVLDTHWIFDVEIPDDAQVYHEDGKSKADKIILLNKRPFDFKQVIALFDPYEAIAFNPEVLTELDQTEELCMAAIQKCPDLIQSVHNQTEKICLEAVKRNPSKLAYVRNRTEKVCLEAVRQNGMLLYYLWDHEKTPKVCLEAIKQNGRALMYVKDQTVEICIRAVMSYSGAIAYVYHELVDDVRKELTKRGM